MVRVKIMYKAWITLTIILICLIGTVMIGRKMNIMFQKKIKHDKLLSITYSNSGDMNGNVDSTTLDTEKMIITTKYATMHSDPIEITEYSISKENIEELNNIIKKNHILELSKLPMGDIFAYDAPTKTLNITCDNSQIGGSSYDTYSINYYMKLSKKNYEQLKEVTDYLFSLLKKDKKINNYTENN